MAETVDPIIVPDGELTLRERVWLANQRRKQLGARSKFVPHQGKRERARRLKRMQQA